MHIIFSYRESLFNHLQQPYLKLNHSSPSTSLPPLSPLLTPPTTPQNCFYHQHIFKNIYCTFYVGPFHIVYIYGGFIFKCKSLIFYQTIIKGFFCFTIFKFILFLVFLYIFKYIRLFYRIIQTKS